MGRPREPLLVRFWRHVDVRLGGCWPWTSWRDVDGYGIMEDKASGKQLKAHRVSYLLNKGEIPFGALIRHTCDTSACVNPAHLLLGTTQDNIADKVARGRTPRGEGHWRSKLTDLQRQQIYGAPGTHESIAKQFGVSRATVSLIKERKISAHVNPPL